MATKPISMKRSRNQSTTAAVDAMMAKYPSLPSTQLAKMLVKKHPLIFNNVDHARCAVRYRRGAQGSEFRKFRKLEAPTTPKPVLTIPPSSERVFKPFVMGDVERCLVLSDIHLPYHTIAALSAAINEGKRRNCDGILLNGDLLDCHLLSDFEKDPGARSFREERQTAIAFLAYLRQEFPKARIVFKEGNHDERVGKYMMRKAPEIFDQEIHGLQSLLHLDEFDVEHVHEKQIVYLGKLACLHGHELPNGISAPVNPARGAYLRAKVCALVSHHHRTSEHTETTLDGSVITTWSTGCLSDLHPAYAPFNSWNHGAAIVEVESDCTFHVHNFRIANGKLLN